MKPSRLFPLLAWLMLLLFSAGLRAQTAAEPTVQQIYQVAAGGDIRGARAMVDQVIQRHPDSAKAHYVKAELAAQDQDAGTAKAELQVAEKLAPGLSFARPEAVSALRAQVDGLSSAASPAGQPAAATQRMGAPPEPPVTGLPFGGVLIAAVAGVGLFAFLRRRRAAAFANRGGAPYAGDHAFGRGYGPAGGPGYPQQQGMGAGYPQQGMGAGYPQQGTGAGMYPPGQAPYPMGNAPQGGLGSSVMRGLGTGLAVGAGALAAHEIGRRILEQGRDGNEAQGAGAIDQGADPQSQSQIARDAGLGALAPSPNQDLGGQDFGIAGGGGWDDGGGGDVGGDWDS